MCISSNKAISELKKKCKWIEAKKIRIFKPKYPQTRIKSDDFEEIVNILGYLKVKNRLIR